MVNNPPIKSFWIVTRPTKLSTIRDIVFQTDIKGLDRQFKGGLNPDDVVGMFLSKNEALYLAHDLIPAPGMKGEKSAAVKARAFRMLASRTARRLKGPPPPQGNPRGKRNWKMYKGYSIVQRDVNDFEVRLNGQYLNAFEFIEDAVEWIDKKYQNPLSKKEGLQVLRHAADRASAGALMEFGGHKIASAFHYGQGVGAAKVVAMHGGDKRQRAVGDTLSQRYRERAARTPRQGPIPRPNPRKSKLEEALQGIRETYEQGPSEDDIIIQHDGTVAQYGNIIAREKRDYLEGEVDGWISGHMAREQFFPNVWSLSDHGNLLLLSWNAMTQEFEDAEYAARKRYTPKRRNPMAGIVSKTPGGKIRAEVDYVRTFDQAVDRMKHLERFQAAMGYKKIDSGATPGKMMLLQNRPPRLRRGQGYSRRPAPAPNANPYARIGRKCVLIETTAGRVTGKMGGVYGLEGGAVLIKGFFPKVPGGTVRAIEYFDEEKAKREGLKNPALPWRHDFSKERVGLQRTKGGLIMRPKDKPLWGMR